MTNEEDLGETTWDYYNPDIMEGLGYIWDDYDGWIKEMD